MENNFRKYRHLGLALLAVPLIGFAADSDRTQDGARNNPVNPSSPSQPSTSSPQSPTSTPGATGNKTMDSPPLFVELDKDKDGQVSKTEAKRSAEVSARFDEVDTDRNGKISVAEWQASARK